MKPVIFLAAALVLSCSPQASGQQSICRAHLVPQKRGDQALPLVVLLASDPWAMVIGSDSPKFALYDDGVAIYRTESGYRTVKLREDEIAAFQKELRIDDLACLAGDYEASESTDQPTESIFVGKGGKFAKISVYGEPGGPKVPTEIVSAFEKLTTFHRADAKAWLPAKIEVMIWPYEYAPDASIFWPSKWPGFDSIEAVKRGDSYSIFIPASDYQELIEFLNKRKEKGAVQIGGKKWAADVRLPFPAEESWAAGGQ